jgi:sulfite reductase beta subunit-like hemoprotein
MQGFASEKSGKNGDDLQTAITLRRLDGVYKQAGDNDLVMVRVRAPGGRWKSRDLGAVAEIASGLGDGSLHFTTRGDVELHGVSFPVLDQVLDRIRRAGLTGRGGCGDAVRNVVACPGAGLCAEELYDTTELVRRISQEYTGVAAYERLPRKFKISVSGCRKACACPQIQDIGIVACSASGGGGEPQPCFDMYLAGGLGRNPILARKVKQLFRPEDVLRFIRAAVECFDELGDRKRKQLARMKFLAEKLGHEQLLSRIVERMAAQTWEYQI